MTGFSNYIGLRWGTPLQSGATLPGLLNEIVKSSAVYKKRVGMQMQIEGLADGGSLPHELSRPPISPG